jgi:hypothetical protein
MTEKTAALLVSVSFVNMTLIPSPTASPVGGVLAFWAPDETLRHLALRHSSRITGSGYRVFKRHPVGVPGVMTKRDELTP